MLRVGRFFPVKLFQARLSLVPRLSVRASLAPLFLTNRPLSAVTPLPTANPGNNPPHCLFVFFLLLLATRRGRAMKKK